MADNLEDAGSKKLGVHMSMHSPDKEREGMNIDSLEERYNLWPHEGDDDLPNATDIKRGKRTVRRDYHRGIRLNVWLTANERKRIERLQKRYQLTFQDWVRRAIDLDEKERPSEATQYVRQIVPEPIAVLGERACILMGEIKMAEAERHDDWETRKALRQEASDWQNGAAWFTDVRKAWERLANRENPS